jgi:hypothetical protein
MNGRRWTRQHSLLYAVVYLSARADTFPWTIKLRKGTSMQYLGAFRPVSTLERRSSSSIWFTANGRQSETSEERELLPKPKMLRQRPQTES